MYLDPRWLILIASTSIAFSSLSPIVTVRKLNFFASALPHASLLSIALGYMLSAITGFDPTTLAIVISVPLSFLQMYLVQRGVDENIATSVFVAFTTSASVAAMYYILTKFPAQVSLWSYILGDPLLSTWSDVAYALAVSAAVAALSVVLYRKEVLIGVDRDYAMLIGLNVRLHDYAVVALLTVASVGLLRVVGFVLEHVVLLLPSAIAVSIARDSRDVLWMSIVVSMFSGIVGLVVALALDIAPSATFGLTLFAVYLATLARGGER